jgi:hypothetical protein
LIGKSIFKGYALNETDNQEFAECSGLKNWTA